MEPAVLVRTLLLRQALRRHERWSRARLARHQERALQQLREHALSHSPFYRRLHRGLERAPLTALPVLTKTMLMEHFDALVTDRAVRRADVEAHARAMDAQERFRGRYQVALTSGSTGQRGIFLWSAAEWAMVLASYARANDWAGLRPGLLHPLRLAVVSSTAPWHQSARVGASLRSPLVRTTRLDATQPLPELIARLEAARPESLVAYASMARTLADAQLAGQLHLSPRAVMCSSEVLSAEARRRIAQAWGQQPFEVYAATETAGIGAECAAHAGLHLFEDLVLTEVVDEQNRPVPPGTYGAKVLVSVLFSRTQPLIRYELSDSICVSTARCPCGLPFDLLAGIQGRQEDLLELADGHGGSVSIAPNLFHQLLEPAPVAAWQVVQEQEGLRVLLAGAAPGLDAQVLAAALTRALEAAGAAAPRVWVEHVEALARTAAGKARLIQARGARAASANG